MLPVVDGRIMVSPVRSVRPKSVLVTAKGTTTSSASKPLEGSSEWEIELKSLLLNPAPAFRDVVEDARCVVVAGGTMSPVSDSFDPRDGS